MAAAGELRVRIGGRWGIRCRQTFDARLVGEIGKADYEPSEVDIAEKGGVQYVTLLWG
jgi:hypothetical protein